MLPPGPGASEARAAQKSALAGFVHEASTSASLGELITRLEKATAGGASAAASSSASSSPLDEWALANVREASRDFARASAVPKELAQKKAALESSAYAAWLEARTKSDFSIFAPALREWIELCQEIAKKISPGSPTYDVLLDEFEGRVNEKREQEERTEESFFFFLPPHPENFRQRILSEKKLTLSLFFFLSPSPLLPFTVGATEKRVLEVFECVKAGVVPLRKEILEKGKKIPSSSFGGGRTSFDPKVQAKLCEEIALDLGFDLEKGRLDVSFVGLVFVFFFLRERERKGRGRGSRKKREREKRLTFFSLALARSLNSTPSILFFLSKF